MTGIPVQHRYTEKEEHKPLLENCNKLGKYHNRLDVKSFFTMDIYWEKAKINLKNKNMLLNENKNFVKNQHSLTVAF